MDKFNKDFTIKDAQPEDVIEQINSIPELARANNVENFIFIGLPKIKERADAGESVGGLRGVTLGGVDSLVELSIMGNLFKKFFMESTENFEKSEE